MVAMDGAHADELLADLDSALAELEGAANRGWERGLPGKWTAGEHVAHIAATLAESADTFEKGAALLRAGFLPPRPRRGPMQWLWVHLVIAPGRLPRGGKTAARFVPANQPDRSATLRELQNAAARHRALTQSLSTTERDRLWIANPFLPRWHYTLPEILRAHAVHARHHAKLIAEILEHHA